METTQQPGDGKPDRQYRPNEKTWLKRSEVEAEFKIRMLRATSLKELEVLWQIASRVFHRHLLSMERLGKLKDELKADLKLKEETIGKQSQFIAL